MTLTDMIPKRRSVRSYRPEGLPEATLADLERFIASLTPLISGAGVAHRLISTADANFLQKWQTPHALAIFAEDTDDAFLNAGYLFQQVDLYLQAHGLGSCWVGLGWLKDAAMTPPGMRLAVLMPFGLPDGVPLRSGAADFRRRAPEEIADRADVRLEPARLAPSATNSQPWYFTHDGEDVHVWRARLGRIRQRTHGRLNLVDMGIALAHLALSGGERFRWTRQEPAPELPEQVYVGTIRGRGDTQEAAGGDAVV